MFIAKYKYELSMTLFLIIVIFVIYPKASSYIPHELWVGSNNYKVSGYYYPLNMDQSRKLLIKGNQVIIKGFDVTFINPSNDYEITRNIPEEFLPLLGQDTTWKIIETAKSKEFTTFRVFENTKSKAQVNVALPYWNSYPDWCAFKLSNNRELLILASGNFKQGEKVYLAYILIENYS